MRKRGEGDSDASCGGSDLLSPTVDTEYRETKSLNAHACIKKTRGRGLDVDFLVRSEPEEITARARRMLEMAEEKGGYALGSGNSIPSYIPPEHYFAMLRAAF